MKVGAIIQARTRSSRLPRKVLQALPYQSPHTVLQQVIRRVQQSQYIHQVVVATTPHPDDIPIIEIAQKEGVEVWRGSEEDVLRRYYEAAAHFEINVIVRITSDCPCIDAHLIDQGIQTFFREKADYVSNTIERTYPHGLDFEVFSFEALQKMHLEAQASFEREHVTPYLYQTCPQSFRIIPCIAPPSLHRPDIRVTLDTHEDYALLCAVFDFLYSANPYFEVQSLIDLFEQKPWLSLINHRTVQKKVSYTLEEELEEAKHILTLQGLHRIVRWLESHNS